MNCFEAPLIVTEPAGNRAWAAKTLPVLRWQARQWQTETRTGSTEVIAESWPQEQEAVRVGIGSFRRGMATASSYGSSDKIGILNEAEAVTERIKYRCNLYPSAHLNAVPGARWFLVLHRAGVLIQSHQR